MAFPHSLHAWEANKFYAVGDVVRAQREEYHTLAFKCIVAGTSGATEPTFPRHITSTVVDNEASDLEWEAFEPLAEQLQALAPTAVIDLFEIELTVEVNDVEDTLRYHAGKNGLISDIIFDGKTYPAAPVEAAGMRRSPPRLFSAQIFVKLPRNLREEARISAKWQSD